MVSQRYVILVHDDLGQPDVYGPLSAEDTRRTIAAWRKRAPLLVFRPIPIRKPVFRDMIKGR